MAIYIARDVVTLVASTTRTLVQVVAGASKPLRIKEVGISFNGTDASLTPIQVDLCRQSTAGTSSALTLLEQEEAREAPMATARNGFSSTEPTTGDIIRTWQVTPAGGLLVVQFPLGDEPIVAASGRLALRAITGAATTPSAASYIVFDE